MADKVVVLTVDTENITQGLSKTQLDEFCDFGQDKSKTPNKDFTTTITLGESIEWVGEAKNGKDLINIEMIVYKGGTNPFPNGKIEINGQGTPNKSVSVVPIKKTENDCEYILHFSINGKPGRYVIDPFLRVQ